MSSTSANIIGTVGTDDTSSVAPILSRPPHEMPRAKWQETIPNYKPGPLTKEQVESFYRDGVLVLPGFYTPEQLEAAKADTEKIIEKLAHKLFKAKRITSLYNNDRDDDSRTLDWTERLLQITREDPHAPVFLTKAGVLPPAFLDMYTDPRMLNIATQLGLNNNDNRDKECTSNDNNGIALNPAWNLRAKMPNDQVTVVPWHQDNSYWEPRVWDEMVLTVWVALVPASRANGCMQFVKGGHKTGKTAKHSVGRGATWYTELAEEELVKELLVMNDHAHGKLAESDILTCEVPAGTAIIFPGTTPHRSLNSTEESIRWSTDFRLHNRTAVRAGKTDLDWFYGLKDSLLVWENGKKGFNATERDQWAGVDRTEAQNEKAGGAAPPDFDPVIVGPWMDLWNVAKHEKEGLANQHVGRYVETLKDGDAKLVQGYKERNNW